MQLAVKDNDVAAFSNTKLFERFALLALHLFYDSRSATVDYKHLHARPYVRPDLREVVFELVRCHVLRNEQSELCVLFLRSLDHVYPHFDWVEVVARLLDGLHGAVLVCPLNLRLILEKWNLWTTAIG